MEPDDSLELADVAAGSDSPEDGDSVAIALLAGTAGRREDAWTDAPAVALLELVCWENWPMLYEAARAKLGTMSTNSNEIETSVAAVLI